MLTIIAAMFFVTTANASDSVACRAEATVENAQGVASVDHTLYASCMQAQGSERTALNSWVAGGSCPVDLERFQSAANAQAHSCRLSAVELDASGHPRVNRGAVRRCMAEVDFEQTSPKRALAWAEQCHAATVAAAE